ncbi:MAG: chromate efflux transporter [Thiomonas sp.]
MRSSPSMQRIQASGPIFLAFLRLGLTAFGGPIAHLEFFRREFVERRGWLSAQAYGDLVALCQFLPGPASSQVGIGLGLMRGGMRGALAAWLGFTLPSALAMAVFALLLPHVAGLAQGAWLHGLKLVAVAVVAQALWGMGRSLCPDRERASLAVAAAVLTALAPGVGGQLAVIALGAAVGRWLLRAPALVAHAPLQVPLRHRSGVALLAAFGALLLGLPLLAAALHQPLLALFSGMYQSGALVFGGGHVVLPLLQAQIVPQGMDDATFVAGYGAAQAVPGPLFTFAAFLGAAAHLGPGGWIGAGVALVGIFLPGFLLVTGALPLWASLRHHPALRSAMLGINAAVVGLLLAAFYDPVWTAAIHTPRDFALALAALLLLQVWRVPPWAVVIGGAALTGLLGWG